MNNGTVSQRITIDLSEVPAQFVELVKGICNVLIHQAHDQFGSLAVMIVTPIETEGENDEQEN